MWEAFWSVIVFGKEYTWYNRLLVLTRILNHKVNAMFAEKSIFREKGRNNR